MRDRFSITTRNAALAMRLTLLGMLLVLLALGTVQPVLAHAEEDARADDSAQTHEYPIGGYVDIDKGDFTLVPLDGEESGFSTQSASETEVSLETLILSTVLTRSRDEVDVLSYDIDTSDFEELYKSLITSHPELFDVVPYCNVSYYIDSGTVVAFTPYYTMTNFDDTEVIAMRTNLMQGVADAMSWIPGSGSDLQKVKAAHDWLASNVAYDYDAAGSASQYTYEGTAYGAIARTSGKFYPWCAYGALVARSCVCQGYAGAFQLLMDMLGIPCTTVGAHNHAWNRVCVDGSWYHVDATWDADDGRPGTNFFMRSDAGIIAQDKHYSGYYASTGELTHADYNATEVPGTDTRYDSWGDAKWSNYWLQLGRLASNQVTSFSLSDASLSLADGNPARLAVCDPSPVDANLYMALWSSSNTDVAWVLQDGLVVPMGESGTSTITCNVAGAQSTCEITVPQSLETAVVAPIPDQVYTGNELRPGVTVTLGSTMLTEGEDYELSYANNVDVGTGRITITGVGSYCGSLTARFSIVAPAYNRDGWVTLPSGAKAYARGGRLVTGWMDLGTSKFWFHPDGSMATGWTDVEVNGKVMHYYFNPASGNLARGTWMTIGGQKYYFRPSGNMATGFADIDDNGVTKKYYFDGSGQMLTGWQDVELNGKVMHYYFRPAGSMATGWATIDGEKYYFRSSGNMATGWADVNGNKHYFDAEGRMLTGWQEIGGKTYYFRASGAMQTGRATIDSKT